MLSVLADTGNHISAFCSDVAGNLPGASAPPCTVPTYTRNTENQLVATGGATCTEFTPRGREGTA